MKRWAVGALVVLAALAGGTYWAWNSLDFVVKAAIERFAPGILGVAVQVREVRLSAADGRGTLTGIEIGNPPGYTAPRALRAGTVSVAIDPSTLADDVVVIREIVVRSPEIAYEVKGGTNNLEAIRRHVEAHVKRSGGDATGEAGTPRPKGRRYVIGRIVLRDARVTMTGPLLKGGGLTFALPDIELRDIGRRSGGVTAAEAAAQVTAALVARVARGVLTNAEALRRGGVQGAMDALRGLLPK